MVFKLKVLIRSSVSTVLSEIVGPNFESLDGHIREELMFISLVLFVFHFSPSKHFTDYLTNFKGVTKF